MNIEKFCEIYNFGKVTNITKLSGGFMHKMFKVETDKGIYCIKILNPEVMSREDAYNNFVVSENISNLAKKNGIPVSSALDIDGDYLKKLDDDYYMIFDFIDGKTLKDDEITIEHCKKIGNILARIHSLNYKEVGLEPNIVEYKRLYDWESYINNPNFSKMSYRNLLLDNYRKYNSILKRANERFNLSNIKQTICHRDMDPKNVMWDKDDNPIIIDWECAGVANPERELIEDALCWSGFLSDNFNKEKFSSMFLEYAKYRSIQDIDWYDVICGNLVGRFGWLKYNVERSLGIVSNDEEEMKIAENEAAKTIDEINRYLELIGTMYDIISDETKKQYTADNKYIEILQENIELLKGMEYSRINAGFTNKIYSIGNYIVRICTDTKNEENFKNEIDFYLLNKDNEFIPKLYLYDTSKTVIPYYYEVIQKLNGNTFYEIWYKLSDVERKETIKKIVNIMKSYQLKDVAGIDFISYLENRLSLLQSSCNLDNDLYNDILGLINIYFSENRYGLIHNDLHFDNFIYDGNKLSLLDFERCMVAPIDYDFRIFSRYSEEPWLWASVKTDMVTVESDYQDLIPMILENYEELREIPYIHERLEIYSILELLENYKNTRNDEKLKSVQTKIERLNQNRKKLK